MLHTPTQYARWATLALSGGLFAAAALAPWHPDAAVRRATGIVLATLVLWISEIAPLGVIALLIPVAATLSGVLSWKSAVASWGDPIIFLFLGAFLLARALDKHGAFDWIARLKWSGRGAPAWLLLFVLLVSGALSTTQNNTAVTAMLLPAVLALAAKAPFPAATLLALSYGATFGGMATPVGTAPNFIGYRAMKEIDPTVNFLGWMWVGLPVWGGTMLIGWAALELARRIAPSVRLFHSSAVALAKPPQASVASARDEAERLVGSAVEEDALRADSRRRGRRWAAVAFIASAAVWLAAGAVLSATDDKHSLNVWVRRYLPESLVPVAAACGLFMIRIDAAGRTVLDRRDFQALDWDTLFLIAGGLCLGQLLETSGAARALAQAVAGVAMPSMVLMLLLGGVTVLLSELTSNTATASLMVPIAATLAAPLGIAPVQAIWLVALAASLGFALPVSTPPNAIVYGTRQIPLRLMIVVGLAVDVLALLWLVLCIRWLG